MKKLFSIFVLSIVFACSAFSYGFFSNRFFEIKFDTSLGLSNNTIALDDILQKNLVIDLGKIAEEMPSSGFNVTASGDIFGGIGVNILGIHAGVDLGLDLFTKFTIADGIFDLLGTGNVDEDGNRKAIDVGMNFEGQSFAHIDANAAFKLGKLKFDFTPSIFAPLFHLTTDNSYIKLNNTDDAEFTMDVKTAGLLYLSNELSDFTNFDIGTITNKMFNSLGFDITASVGYQLFGPLTLIGNIRIPMAPGHLNYKYGVSYEESIATSFEEIMAGNMPSLNPTLTPSDAELVDFKIHRPFKLNVGADFAPFGNLLHLNASFGLGVRNPFSKIKADTYAYCEYFAGCKVSALNIVGASISTEYTDEVFKHAIGFFLNLRATEIDFTISTSSSDFAKSCKGAGIAANLVLYAGF